MPRRRAATVRWRATTAEPRASSFDASTLAELVADAVHGLHVARRSRIGLQLAPDVLDVRVDRAIERLVVHGAVGGGLCRANRVQQLRACEDAARMARERREQVELGRRQIDRRAPARGTQARNVEAQVTALEDVVA